jgi:DNA repair photolyase
VNCKIVEYSSKVLAPRIVRRYALSKGFAKGPQGVYNAYCNCSGGCLFCFSS